MSTSKTYQQSLVDAGSETRPPMLERVLKLQTVEDLQGDALLHFDAEIELMNLILLSIPNDIYNSVDACTSAKDMWKRVERLMRGTIQNKVDRETRFTNEFDQFVAEPGEALVSVYNRFAQLMNDLERNGMQFIIVTINTKFLNSLQSEWLKYVTQVRLAKPKKLEKSHNPLALVAHSEYEAYVSGESSFGQVNENEQDDDEIPTKQMSQDIMEEVSLTIDEAKQKKMADEMLRQRCTSRDEHQYHIDQMKNFLKSDIVWESRKEILVSPHPRKTTPLVQSCQRDLEAPALSLINQDLLYLKKGSLGPEKIPDYKNLNKNDIEDMYLLIMNGKVPDYAEIGLLWSLLVFIRSLVIKERVHDFQLGIESYQQKVNLTAPIISFPGIEKHKIVLEGLKSYNNDVKYGYIQRDLTNDEVEYLKLFEEDDGPVKLNGSLQPIKDDSQYV
ncbi:hypothetical protein Tco_1377970 [Tanacetum coccineum]